MRVAPPPALRAKGALRRRGGTSRRKAGGGVAAVIPAAGKGSRLGTAIPKPFVRLSGRPLLVHTLSNLKKTHTFSEVVVAAAPDQIGRMRALLKKNGLGRVKVVPGGRTRAESVKSAVLGLSADSDWVLIHDAARPLVSKAVVARLLSAARKAGAAICALPVSDTLKEVDPSRKTIRGTRDRKKMWLAQTPQVFGKKVLLKRYRALKKAALSRTDEAALFDGTRQPVLVVPGEARNLKITSPADIGLFNFFLKRES